MLNDYPFKPPRFYFKTKIFHPNFREDCFICCHSLPLLWTEWDPSTRIIDILKKIQNLLVAPNVDEECGAFNHEALKLYKEDKTKFEAIAREWTEKYAQD